MMSLSEPEKKMYREGLEKEGKACTMEMLRWADEGNFSFRIRVA